MIKNYILITLRSMMKSKLFVFINVIGLAISISCCIVAYYNYRFNAQFDTVHEKADRIYRVSAVRKYQNEETQYGIAPIGLGAALRQSSEADRVTRYNFGGMTLKRGDDVFGEDIRYVDPEFFDMFTFEFIHGGPDGFNKSSLMISDRVAIQLFGTTDVVGKTVSQVLGDSLKEFQIGGVYKHPPINSSFSDEGFAHMENYFDNNKELDENNWYYRTTIFVEVDDPSRLSALAAVIDPYKENNNKVREDFIISRFVLDPFVGMAVRDEYEDRQGTWTSDASPMAAVIGCAVMAVMVLLIACFNLTNTALAMSSRRLKEIGIRKVMGSMRKQLIAQFLAETFLICILGLGLGMLLNNILLMPAFNALWPYMKLQTEYLAPDFIVAAVGGLLIVSLIAGAYPAFYISRFEPVTILKGKLKFGGTSVLSLVLLVLQFSISLIGIAGGIAFWQNARYQRDIDLGFNVNGVVFTYVNNGDEYEALRNEIVKNPDITSIAGSTSQINSNFDNDPVKSGDKEIETDILRVGDNYLATAGLTLIEGRDFMQDSETDRKESIIVSEEFASKMGWDKPIGQQVTWMDTARFYVIGVVQNVYNRGLWRKVQPMMLRYAEKANYRHVVVSAPIDKLVSVNKEMEKSWKAIFPNRLYNGRYMNEEVVEATTVNTNLVKMFVFLGAVAMLLSATGLFTLVSLNIVRRMKEIGVRKVLGASMTNITRVINGKFAILLVLATVLGSWASSFLLTALMSSIWAFYQPSNLWTYTMSAALLFGVAILSIGSKVYQTARMSPVNSLRDE